MSIPIEKVCTDTFTMSFFRFGRGEKTLVILPGLSIQSVMGAADAVADEYSSMADAFTLYVFDRRAELPSAYTVKEMARDTIEAFGALGLNDIYLFGASQGGMIALEIATEHPKLIRKLALGSTSACFDEKQYRALSKWIRLAKEKDGVGLYLDFGRSIYPSKVFEQYREALISAGKTVTDAEFERFMTLAKGTRGFDVRKKLKGIRCPVLAIGATDDAVLGAEATLEIAEGLNFRPDFELYMYDGYGHAAFDTAPDYRERLLGFFLK